MLISSPAATPCAAHLGSTMRRHLPNRVINAPGFTRKRVYTMQYKGYTITEGGSGALPFIIFQTRLGQSQAPAANDYCEDLDDARREIDYRTRA